MSRLLGLLFVFAFVGSLGAQSPKQPNILLIMADDLGYSDLGCYGSEIQTPNLDALAAGGVRFTQFYNTGRCWPTRAALLTGYYPQSVRRDTVDGARSGGRGKRPSWAPLICKPLRHAGYRNYHTGKWHLDSMPIASGFDRSYYLKDQHRFFNPTLHWKDDKKLPPVPKGTDFYATTALGDHVIETLSEHQDKYSEQPFFHYLAFAAPHFPLHALPEDIDRYRQMYRVGWDEIRKQRHSRMQDLGLVSAPLSDVMPTVGPPYDFPDAMKQLGDGEVNRPVAWNELTDKQKEFQSTKMAIHAAMIHCMDRQIGRIIEKLKELEVFDNTVVLFLSDNGASAEIMVRGDGHDPEAPMGSWASHLCLGPGWSTVCNTPFRYHKTWTHEGGTATPLIVHWPKQIAAAGQRRHDVGHVIDIWPTLLEVAKANRLDETELGSEGPDRPGKSLVDTFTKDRVVPRTIWFQHEGNRALRVGDWKVSAVNNGDWELYRLSVDRSETTDLSKSDPDRLSEMTRQWQRITDENRRRATELWRE